MKGPWVIFLIDPNELGAGVKAVGRRGLSTTFRPDLTRRFSTKASARTWLAKKVPKTHRIRTRFRPLIEKL